MKSLINPFEIYTEKILFVFGLLFAVLTAFISYFTNTLLFGSLKVINNYNQSLFAAFINLGITIFSNSILLFVFARIKYVKSRWIDIFNVVLVAHSVMYVLLYFTALPVVQRLFTAIELEILDNGLGIPNLSLTQMFILIAFALCSLVLLIYFFYLLVIGMKIAINSKRTVDGVLLVVLVLVWNTILQVLNPFIT